MADRASLEFLGFILGGVTAAVILTAFIVVRNTIDANVTHDSVPVVPAALTSQR